MVTVRAVGFRIGRGRPDPRPVRRYHVPAPRRADVAGRATGSRQRLNPIDQEVALGGVVDVGEGDDAGVRTAVIALLRRVAGAEMCAAARWIIGIGVAAAPLDHARVAGAVVGYGVEIGACVDRSRVRHEADANEACRGRGVRQHLDDVLGGFLEPVEPRFAVAATPIHRSGDIEHHGQFDALHFVDRGRGRRERDLRQQTGQRPGDR